MFTGIVQKVSKGVLVGNRIKIERCWEDLSVGESISVNGVCLTLADFDDMFMYFDVGAETLKLTNLKYEKLFNLERALNLGNPVSGHFVTGHVDGMVKLLTKHMYDTTLYLTFSMPSERWGVVKKGSIALNGVSLTIANVSLDTFTVQLIPHTIENTTFKFITSGSFVNYEIDVLARFIHNELSNFEKCYKDGINV